MPVKLVHHTLESMSGGVSPFDAAIMKIVTGRDVRIACPYLGVKYLRRVIDRAVSWRLLTDVEAWLASQTPASLAQVLDFIVAHREQVHHCADLHAKVVIGGEHALVGSANLTTKGISRRIEMGVRFKDCEQVVELTAWFDQLWNETGPVNEAELRACAASIPAPTPRVGMSRLTVKSPKVSAKLKHPIAARNTTSNGRVASTRATPVDARRPECDVLNGEIGKRTNRIHDVLVAAREPLSPNQIKTLANCNAVSEHLLTMEKRGYARRASRGLWELTAAARKLVAAAGG